jgi:hypothetical protein
VACITCIGMCLLSRYQAVDYPVKLVRYHFTVLIPTFLGALFWGYENGEDNIQTRRVRLGTLRHFSVNFI